MPNKSMPILIAQLSAAKAQPQCQQIGPPHTISLYFPMLGDTINLLLCIKPIIKANMVGFYYCVGRPVTTWRNINKKCMVTKHYMTEHGSLKTFQLCRTLQ